MKTSGKRQQKKRPNSKPYLAKVKRIRPLHILVL